MLLNLSVRVGTGASNIALVEGQKDDLALLNKTYPSHFWGQRPLVKELRYSIRFDLVRCGRFKKIYNGLKSER